MKSIYQVSLILGSLLILSNCAPSYGPHFTQTKSRVTPNDPQLVEVVEVETVYEVVPSEEPVFEAIQDVFISDVFVEPEVQEPTTIVERQVVTVKEVPVAVEEQPVEIRETRRETRAKKREFRSLMKERIKEAKEADNSDYLLMMILAFLIPPLGVGLTYGLEQEFLISLLLTLLFFVPGMIYSLVMVHRYYN